MTTVSSRYRTLLSVLTAAVVLASSQPARAQYFGQNKVQYRQFDFKVLKTDHFDIYFYPEERAAVEHAARLSERWHARLTKLFQHELRGRQPLILYAAHPHFEQTNAISGQIGESTGGVTEMLRRRIVLPLGGPMADTDHVIGHELVHAYQFDITTGTGQQGGMPGALRLPLWFIEGMAEYLSLGPIDPHTAMWMRDAVRQEKLPEIDDLDDPDYFPYRWGHAFWAYVAGRSGDQVVGQLLRDAGATGDVKLALETYFDMKTEELSKEWHAALRGAYEPFVRGTEAPTRYGRLLVGGRKLGGELNVSPALSPDGTRMAFLSERGLFSIDLYIADVATGKILDKVSETALDPHFSSLQFINSAGAWDRTGRRLAFAGVTEGTATLAIYDMDGKHVEREVKLRDVDEVFNPTWSPDGNAICFTGMSGGVTDLFIHDLSSGATRRLTDDAFADLQPAWSPDGRRIAFATDRFSSRLPILEFGPYRLALIDPAGGTPVPVPGFEGSKHINPQWAPDGRTLYFISDRNGASNLYRVDVADGTLRQVTNLPTGISGITATSPALSSAAAVDRLAATVYQDGKHEIFVFDAPQVLAGAETPLRASTAPATLPPEQRRTAEVSRLLADPTVGLPEQATGAEADYKAGLGLDYVGQPTLTVGSDRFGAFAGGGIAFSFSDMLGNHSLATAVQINSSFSGNMSAKDIGAAALYTNLKNRWNWGVLAEQFPYRSGALAQSVQNINGQNVIVQDEIIYRQTSRSLSGIVAYPFNRAHRVEFSAGYRGFSFDEQTRRTIFSARTGELLADDTSSRSLGDPLHLGQGAAALVYDTSIFGATSPIAGQRYRLEYAPTVGTLTMSNVLADYRRYFMPADLFTIAGRVMHYGRYGSDSEDSRLTPLFVGYQSLVRGYDVGSFEARECVADEDSSCPAFDRLLGSRLAVANVEFRFPLLRPFGLRRGVYGPVPVEVAFFGDAGVAWDSNNRPQFLDGNRDWVTSAGVAFRVNAFGFAILELDFVKPFQRPDKGWMWQFGFSPGF